MRIRLIALMMISPVMGCTPKMDSTPFPILSSEAEIVDLTYAYDSETIFWPTASGFEKTTDFEGVTPGGYYYSAYSFSMAEHGGTHLDAPVHFSEGKRSSDQIPLEHLMGEAILIDVRQQAAQNRDYLVAISDFEDWESRNDRIPDGSIVLLRTGFGSFWPDREKYMGTSERGDDAVSDLHFPGIDPEAASWLVNERSIHAIGLDTPSIDRGQSSLFETHQILFEADIPAFENVANLDRLPEQGFVVIALPMKIRGGSGGPLRIIALLPPTSAE